MKSCEYFTAEEIARKFKVSKQFIYNLSSPKVPFVNRIPSTKVGRLRRFKLDDVIEYFEDRTLE